MKKKITLITLALIIFASVTFYFFSQRKNTPKNNYINSAATTSKDTLLPEPSSTKQSLSFNKSQYSLPDPTSLWVIVNKKNAIPITFAPNLTVPSVRLRLSADEEQMQINTQTAPAIKEMFNDASKDGGSLVFGSGYRSAAKQKLFYNSYVAKDGKKAADSYSARPGHSEHQTGFAADVTSPSGKCHLQICWEDTPEGQWLASNSWRYGFIIRYPNGKTNITGYQYEPWHVRYVGKDLAAKIHESGQTLEEFFGLPDAPTYD